MLTGQLIILLVLLFFSGFFSSSETALFSISRTRARHISKEGGKANELIYRMKQDPHRLLSTILIGNNIVNVGAAALATAVTLQLFPNYAVGLATGVMTFLIVVFGEVIPKSIATRNNLLIARATIYPIFWLSILFYPIILFLNFIPRITGRIKKTPAVTEQELMTFVEVVEEEGEIKEEERELIHKIFELDDTKTSEIMTPRADMFAIGADQELKLDEIVSTGFSRVPVFEGDVDHIIGILNIKDLFLHYAGGKPIDLRNIIREPYFVPENKKLDSLLKQFKKRRTHMAIVVDEHGGVSGLITLEDALEEIVGEIEDETDKEEPHIITVDANRWLVPGKSDIDDVNAITGMNIPDSPEYDTFSGFVLDRIGRIPKEKEQIPIDNYMVTVQEIDGIRIKQYEVRQTAPAVNPESDTAVGENPI